MKKQFNVYFADRRMNITGMASTTMPDALRIIEDLEVEEIETASTSLDFTISYDKSDEIYRVVDVGYYLLYDTGKGSQKFFTIIRTDKNATDKTMQIYAEEGGLDLLNEIVMPYAADKSYPIKHYVDKILYDTGFSIGINMLGNEIERKLEWDDKETATKRLLDICKEFDNAEIVFSFNIKNMLVTEKLLHIYKKRGTVTETTLRLDKDVNNIITSKSIENLATALIPEGDTPKDADKPITLNGYKYDDGRFYVKNSHLLDRESIKKWSRYLSPTEKGTDRGHIVKHFEYKTDNQAELCEKAVEHLRKISEVEQNFEVDIAKLPDDIKIGDRVNIVDTDGRLYLSARVLRLETSRVEQEATAILGEFLIRTSGISQRLEDLADKIESIKGLNSSFVWIRYADDELGNGFSAKPAGKKYMAVKSVVNEPVPSDDPADYDGLWSLIQGSQGIDGTNKYIWIKYADNVGGGGMSDNPDGKEYIGIAYNKDTPTASNNASDYSWFLTKGADGKDGKTPYFYIAWADSLDGKTGFTIDKTQANNKGYLGTYSSYNTTQSTSASDYAWVKLAGAFESELTELQNTINKVNKVVVQFEEPAQKNNTLWWKTESATSDKIVGYYIWENNKWIPQTIEQSMLNIVELNAVEINGSVITGSSFLNHWNKGGIGREGVMRIEDGSLSSDYTALNGGKGSLILDEAKLLMQTWDSDGNQTSSMQLSPETIGIRATDALGNDVGGTIKAEALNNYGWKTIKLASGYVAAENNPPAYKKTVNLDGTTTIKWRGQVTTTGGTIPAGGSVLFASNIPVEARPLVNEFSLAATSTANTGVRIAVLTDGRFQLWTQSAVGYVVLSGFTYETKS